MTIRIERKFGRNLTDTEDFQVSNLCALPMMIDGDLVTLLMCGGHFIKGTPPQGTLEIYATPEQEQNMNTSPSNQPHANRGKNTTIQLSRQLREIRLELTKTAYVLSFKHPLYQMWWICFSKEYLKAGTVVFSTVIFAI